MLVPHGSTVNDRVVSHREGGGGGGGGEDVTSILKDIRNAFEKKPAKKRREFDVAIEDILKNDRLSPDEKAKAYGQVIQQQRFWRERSKNDTLPKNGEGEQLAVNFIVDAVPKTFKSRAERLVNFLKESGITWTDRGELIDLNGQKVTGSHITDLVNDLMRYRKTVHPVGRNVLARDLNRLNVPHELVGNEERWDAIHRSTPSRPNAESTKRKSRRRRRGGDKYYAEEEEDEAEGDDYYGVRTPPPSPDKSTWIKY